MSNNQLLQDIGNLLGTNIDLQEDINDIFELVKNKFQEKYVKKIQALIEGNRLQAQENPTKEIALLQASKPFINPDTHSQIDMFIEAMNTFRTFQTINQQVRTIQNHINEKEGEKVLLQDDGVYEIDETCISSKNQSSGGGELLVFILLILFFGIFNSN
jgi:hypothetical protein